MRDRSLVSIVIMVLSWLGVGVGVYLFTSGLNHVNRFDTAATNIIAYQRNIIELQDSGARPDQIAEEKQHLASFQELFPLSTSVRLGLWKVIGGFWLAGISLSAYGKYRKRKPPITS